MLRRHELSCQRQVRRIFSSIEKAGPATLFSSPNRYCRSHDHDELCNGRLYDGRLRDGETYSAGSIRPIPEGWAIAVSDQI